MKGASHRPGPLTRSDLFLPSSDWGSLVVGRTSYTIDVDSKINHVRSNSEARLLQELKYASHLGLPAVMVTLYGRNHTNLARIVSNYIVKGASFQMWVQVPVCQPDLSKYEKREMAGGADLGLVEHLQAGGRQQQQDQPLSGPDRASSRQHRSGKVAGRTSQDGQLLSASLRFDNADNFLAVHPYLTVPHQQERLPCFEQAAPDLCQEVHQPGHSGQYRI